MIVIKRIVIAKRCLVIVRKMLRIAKTHPCVPFQDGTWSTSMLGCEEDDAEEADHQQWKLDLILTSPKIGPSRCARFVFVILCNTL